MEAKKKKSKDTRVELVAELQTLLDKGVFSMESAQFVRNIIAEAKAGEFHDFKNQKYVCGKVALVQLLRQVGLEPLAQRVMAGEFDEEPDEHDKAMMSETIRRMAIAQTQAAAGKLIIRKFESVEEAPKYSNKEFGRAHLLEVCIVNKGTVDGNPSVDLVFLDPDTGRKFTAMTTGKLLFGYAGDIHKKMIEANAQKQKEG